MPRVLNFVVALVGLSAAVAARLVYTPEKQALAGGLLGLSFLLLGWALRGFPVPSPLDPETEAPPVALPRGRLLLGLALALLCVVFTALSVRAFGIEARWRSAWPLHGAAMACLVAAGFALSSTASVSRSTALPKLSGPVRLALLGIVLLATALRVYRLSELPPGCWFDEANNALVGLELLSPETAGGIYSSQTLLPAHSFYLVGWALKVFGPTLLVTRLVVALMGVLAVLFTFFVGRAMYGERAGLFAAFLFAVGRWPLTFSRIGLVSMFAATAVALSLLLLLRTRRTGAVRDAVLTGCVIGYGVCLYFSYRLFVFPLAFFTLAWLVAVVRRKAEGGLRRFFGLVFAIVFSTLVAAAPLIQYVVKNPDLFAMRTSTVSIFSFRDELDIKKALISNVGKHLAMFHLSGDRNARHNLPSAPMLDPATAVLLVAGLGLALFRLRDVSGVTLLVSVFAGLLGGILTHDFEAPQSLRSIESMPGVFLLAALGLDALCRLVRFRWLAGTLALAALSFALWYDARRYFLVQMRDESVFLEHGALESLAAGALARTPDGTAAYVSVFLHDRAILRFLVPSKPTTLIGPTGLPLPETGERDAILLLDKEHLGYKERAVELYPHARLEELKSPGGQVLAESVFVPREDLAALRGLRVKAVAGREERAGFLSVPRFGTYELRVADVAPAEISFPGTGIVPAPAAPGTVRARLPEGLVPLRIVTPAGAVPRLFWTPPLADPREAEPREEEIPASALYGGGLERRGHLARYYRGNAVKPEPDLERVVPPLDTYFHVTPLERPYLAVFTGTLDVPATGLWSLGLRLRGDAKLFVDGALVVEGQGALDRVRGEVRLEKGPHALEIRFFDDIDASRLHLYWTPEGGEETVIPGGALRP
ncbi:MAG: glycosyltransferase family 39 protein [Acidobacteria bacterium]|nr:glycosyltransferase family 39 protein [Acidobacteriota bacterium]